MAGTKHSTDQSCPFCPPPTERIFYESDLVLAIWDGFPISRGHALVLPRQHVASWFRLSGEERAEILVAIEAVRKAIEREHNPDGYNIGINDGAAAGQTIPHLHVHVIPRYTGDVDDPRGGVRHVIPGKADYWSR